MADNFKITKTPNQVVNYAGFLGITDWYPQTGFSDLDYLGSHLGKEDKDGIFPVVIPKNKVDHEVGSHERILLAMSYVIIPGTDNDPNRYIRNTKYLPAIRCEAMAENGYKQAIEKGYRGILLVDEYLKTIRSLGLE